MKKDRIKEDYQPDFEKAAKELDSKDFNIDTLLENFLLNFQVEDFANSVNNLYSIFNDEDSRKAFVEMMKNRDSSKKG